jgi:DNA-binding transcriptional MocR family regulator
MNTSDLLAEALKLKVAFMPREPFFLDNSQSYSATRLDFSRACTSDTEHGLSLLSELIRARFPLSW